jgi:hypothetical protein
VPAHGEILVEEPRHLGADLLAAGAVRGAVGGAGVAAVGIAGALH